MHIVNDISPCILPLLIDIYEEINLRPVHQSEHCHPASPPCETPSQDHVIYSDLVFERSHSNRPNRLVQEHGGDGDSTTYASIDHTRLPHTERSSSAPTTPSPVIPRVKDNASSPLQVTPRPMPYLDGIRLSPVRASPPNSVYYPHADPTDDHHHHAPHPTTSSTGVHREPRKPAHSTAHSDHEHALFNADDLDAPVHHDSAPAPPERSHHRYSAHLQLQHKRPAPPLPTTPRPHPTTSSSITALPSGVPAIPARARHKERDLHSPFEPDPVGMDCVDGADMPASTSSARQVTHNHRQAPPPPPSSSSSPPIIIPRRQYTPALNDQCWYNIHMR